jgi:hypothetical protein
MKKFSTRTIGLVLALVLGVSMIGIGVAFATGAISNLWTSPTITVNAPANSPLIISSDFTTGRSITIGDATPVSVTLANPSPSGAPGYTGVNVVFTINKSGIVVSDVKLEYSPDAGDTWYSLTLTQDGSDALTGTFGPASGFPVGYGYSATTPLRVTFYTAGSYYATAQAIQ